MTDDLVAENKSQRPYHVNCYCPKRSLRHAICSRWLIAMTNAHHNMWDIGCTLATSEIVCVVIYARGMSSCKANFGVSILVLYHSGLFKSKNVKKSIRKTFWFFYSDKKWYVGDQTEYGVLPTPRVANIWLIKNGINLTTLEAFILEDSGFKVVCFEEYHCGPPKSSQCKTPHELAWGVIPL